MAWFPSERKKGKEKAKVLKGNPKEKTTKVREKVSNVTIAARPAIRPLIVGPRRKTIRRVTTRKVNPQETKVQKDVVKAQKEKERKEQQLLRNRKKKRLRNQRMNKKSECLNSMALSWSTKRKMI